VRVATRFPNEASLLRLVSAMAVEISEQWDTGRTCSIPAGKPAKMPGERW